jgi:bifunctional DNA-binding transcriptional regulator/antitoxin component of YhaV-PrlF toxin-antitoxin module
MKGADMTNLQNLLEIPKAYLDEVNHVLLDPNSEVMQKFMSVVAKYGTPEEINRKHIQSRRLENLLDLVAKKSPVAVDDLKWLMEQRDKGAFISEEGYRIQVLGDKALDMHFKDDCAVTLEVSALQYFPWVRATAEQAIAQKSLVPGRFIAVRKMKESEADGDLPAIVAALDIIGASFVETLDTKGTDGSNPHLGGPATITGYFGGIGQPNDHALMWLDEFLYYYTNYGVQHVLNFNAGTILMGFMLYKLGVDIQFKISVFFGSDNPYHALWIMMMAKLFAREDGTSPLIGFNWSNSINNETMELTAEFRKALGFEKVIRFEHHITEPQKSIVIQPYNRRDELIQIADHVPNIAAKHEGGDPELDVTRAHPSDLLDYFRDKEEVIHSGDWDNLLINYMDKVDACNRTAKALTEHGLSFVAAKNLHHKRPA